jgi:hypothetical protein
LFSRPAAAQIDNRRAAAADFSLDCGAFPPLSTANKEWAGKAAEKRRSPKKGLFLI